MVLKWCQSGEKESNGGHSPTVLQWCHNGVTMVLQSYYNRVTVKRKAMEDTPPTLAIMVPWCEHGLTMVFKLCYTGVGVML
jgi:hypothetical protein